MECDTVSLTTWSPKFWWNIHKKWGSWTYEDESDTLIRKGTTYSV